MKFCLISGKNGEDVKQHFIAAAKKRFDTVVYAPLDKVRIDAGEETRIFYKNHDLGSFDAVYVRAFNDDFLFAEVLLDALEHTSAWLPVSLDGYQLTNHKFSSVERVARIGVPVPDTSLTVTPESSLEISKQIGFPIVLKLLRGFGGKGVMLLRSEAELKPVLDTLQVFNEFPSSQQFIEGSATDIRALVIGDEVVGIRRHGEGTEWRANVSAGGRAEIVDLPSDTARMAREVSKLLGLEICGVDFIQSPDRTYFIEANFSPGIMPKYFKGMLAEKIVGYLYERASRTRPPS